MKIFYILSLLLLFHFFSHSQSVERQVISSGGDFYSGSSGSISFTIGEVVTETYTSGSFTITQGFQQPNKEDFVGIKEEAVSVTFKIYPNPSSDFINIDFQTDKQVDILINITDVNGKLVFNSPNILHINKLLTYPIQISNFSKAVYNVNFISNNKVIKSVQFIKN